MADTLSIVNISFRFLRPEQLSCDEGMEKSQMRSHAIQICVHANRVKCVQHHMVFTLLWHRRDRPWTHGTDTETSAHMICMQIWWVAMSTKKIVVILWQIKIISYLMNSLGQHAIANETNSGDFPQKTLTQFDSICCFSYDSAAAAVKMLLLFTVCLCVSSKYNWKNNAKTNYQFTQCIFLWIPLLG